jgi:NhaP-type Na+/H+ or K+/H+ antiporter
MGGYAAAIALHLSGPIAIVVAGMLIGNYGPREAMSATTRERVDPIIAVTYVVVVFSIVVQGLTLARVLRRASSGAASGARTRA